MHAGAERPIVAEPKHAGYVHGESGLDGPALPEPSGPPASTDAVGFIIETCRANPGTWLVPTGPLTNIALALRAAPDLAGLVAGISLMGGGTFGNRTAVAEFNIWADPEAAAVVYGYGGPLIMSGLDVTHQLQATPERIAMVRALPGGVAAIFADLFDFFSGTYVGRHREHARRGRARPVRGDGAHPSRPVRAHARRTSRSRSTASSPAGRRSSTGATSCEVPPPNCDVQTAVDADAAWQVIVESIGAAPPTLR